MPCFSHVKRGSSAYPHKGILRSVTKGCFGHLELPGKVCVFCFLENNQDGQLLHSFEMFTRGCSSQPIAKTKFTRTLGTCMYLLSLDMHDNQVANTTCLDLLAPFLSYRQFLPQLPCWRKRRRERERSEQRHNSLQPCSISLGTEALGQTLSSMPSCPKGGLRPCWAEWCLSMVSPWYRLAVTCSSAQCCSLLHEFDLFSSKKILHIFIHRNIILLEEKWAESFWEIHFLDLLTQSLP